MESLSAQQLATLVVAETSAPSIRIRILRIRDQDVVLDSDLAELYGVSTSAFNQAVKRNIKRFPEDFCFFLTHDERTVLISQNVISKPRRGGRTKAPRVFTEHGALMAATVLNSEQAISMSLYVIRMFVELREQIVANKVILERLTQVEKQLLEHDHCLREVFQQIVPLLDPNSDPKPAKKAGFHPDQD